MIVNRFSMRINSQIYNLLMKALVDSQTYRQNPVNYMMEQVKPQQSFSSVSPVLLINGADVCCDLDATFLSAKVPDWKGDTTLNSCSPQYVHTSFIHHVRFCVFIENRGNDLIGIWFKLNCEYYGYNNNKNEILLLFDHKVSAPVTSLLVPWQLVWSTSLLK